jgi:hypothetical protein
MSQPTSPLADACRALTQTVRGGLDWLIANERELKQDLSGPIRDLRKAVVEARRLQRAAGRKMCVGVFGPSQAGKSYLISALARAKSNPVMAVFGGEHVDFLARINPPGGKESTGLVTRFTVDPPENVPHGFPVELRLLSETDIVKVLANTYVFDVNRDTESEANHPIEPIQAALARLEQRAGVTGVGPLDPVDIVDLEDYCSRRLIRNPRIKVLRRTDYWKTATRIAHRLTPADRAELFALIWGGTEAFTNVYRRLYAVLERFDFAETIYASFDALADRARSIITVDTLAGVGEGTGDSVEAVNAAGRRAPVLRNELAAITAELKIAMRDTPYDFFRHTDLLDFPGYRSRMNLADLDAQLRQNGMREMMIRGKVAYLFERYSDDQELTSMLLCQGPENFEVSDLVPVVYDWIKNTHGATPADRAGQRTALFFIQTKYDKIFEESSGKGQDDSRYVNRLEGNLTKDAYGKQSLENGARSWPNEWAPGTPFQNIFLLRNPTIIQDALFDYEEVDGTMREKAVRDGKAEYLDRLRRAFVDSPAIREHYGDPGAAWDAMMQLNDGGIGRIASALRPVSDPRTKAQQVAARAARLSADVRNRLQPYHVSGDIAEQKKKKRTIAARIANRLKRCFERERFGELLASLQLEAEGLYDLYEIVERRPVREMEEEAAAPLLARDEAVAEEDDFLGELLGTTDDAPKPVPVAAKRTGTSVFDLPTRYAQAVAEVWGEQLDRLGADAQFLRYFEMTSQDWVALTVELQTAAQRQHLADALRAAIERGAAFRQIPKSSLIWKQAKPAAYVVNDYVSHLGFGGARAPNGTEITIDGRSFALFAPRRPVATEPPLTDQPLRYDQAYFRDWVLAFTRLSEDNVEFEAGTRVNIEQNDKLGALLGALPATLP